MIIDIKEYLLNSVGATDWNGETNHDNRSLENLDKLDDILTELEDLRNVLIGKLESHIVFAKGNASAEQLHKKAKLIREKHIIKEFTHTNFEKYWERD